MPSPQGVRDTFQASSAATASPDVAKVPSSLPEPVTAAQGRARWPVSW
ncbi:hypothetical protein JQM64_11310 [Fournierella massiliensis]|nr:hypothetical protein [Fournierella massiliensis]MCF2558099.1 hypothetical protein [Fournierella massiliensis]